MVRRLCRRMRSCCAEAGCHEPPLRKLPAALLTSNCRRQPKYTSLIALHERGRKREKLFEKVFVQNILVTDETAAQGGGASEQEDPPNRNHALRNPSCRTSPHASAKVRAERGKSVCPCSLVSRLELQIACHHLLRDGVVEAAVLDEQLDGEGAALPAELVEIAVQRANVFLNSTQKQQPKQMEEEDDEQTRRRVGKAKCATQTHTCTCTYAIPSPAPPPGVGVRVRVLRLTMRPTEVRNAPTAG